MLNLNGSLTKAGVTYTLWSEAFTDELRDDRERRDRPFRARRFRRRRGDVDAGGLKAAMAAGLRALSQRTAA
jgi:hypothetical protein